MEFSNILNDYINTIGCSCKELSLASTLSNATISRYCSGIRKPNNPSEQLELLIKGLCILIKKYNISSLNEDIIRKSFQDSLKCYDIQKIVNNFNLLVSLLKINISGFSKSLGFDASYLSKIRSGKRKPADIEMFLNSICNYVVNKYNDDDSKKIISNLINKDINNATSLLEYKDAIGYWLCSDYKESKSDDNINKFLTKVNEFDLNEYIRAIHFDDLKVPTIPFKIPKSKNYYGLDEMKQGELDFFKSTVLSKNSKEVFMCSDMQMDDMSKDLEFGKKWMFGIAMMLKKGIHINIIHNLDRPFNEMMLGLESWIPIYMTGQISPYYLTETQSNTFRHLDYVSGNVALCGECISTHHNNGKYYLTTNKEELKYYSKKAEDILSKAKPLMKIFEKENQDTYNANLVAESKIIGERHNILSALPIYTLTRDLLDKILSFNKVSTNDKELILNFYEDELKIINTILSHSKIIDEFSELNKKEFSEIKPILSLSGLFYEKKIYYSYEQYKEHIELIKQINKKNYKAIINNNLSFKNIQIFIREEKWVMISKNDNPTIHFIITHPKLCNAIENFAAPIIE